MISVCYAKKSFRLGGVDFQFDKSKPTESALSALGEGFKRDESQLIGTSHKITVRAYASRPGSEEYNQELSQRRGEWLKNWLVDQGIVASRIQVRAMGEQDIHTQMAEADPQPDLDATANPSSSTQCSG